jgi:hypothetical protein
MPGQATPRILDVELLEAYAHRMRALGCPFDERSAPGLSQHEIEALMEPLQLELPDEARTWWGWRNGQADRRAGLFFPGFTPYSLADAAGEYQLMRKVAAETAEPGVEGRETADELWDAGWFPIDGESDHMVIDCSVAKGEPTPVRLITWTLKTKGPWAASLGDAVTAWCDRMDSGSIVWDAARQLWVIRGDA